MKKYIICDCCGEKVDTRLYDRCPSCGASYKKDYEYEENNTKIEKNRNKKVKMENTNFKKIVVPIFSFILIAILVLLLNNKGILQGYYKSSKVPDFFYYYSSFNTDSTIECEGTIGVKIKDVYKNDYDNDYLVTVEITNITNKVMAVCFDVEKVNDFSTSTYVNEYVSPHKTVTRTFNIWVDDNFEIENLNSITLNNIYYILYDRNYHEIPNERVFYTDKEKGNDKILLNKGELAYENKKLGIKVHYSSDYKYFIIENTSNTLYRFEYESGSLNSENVSEIYHTFYLPTHSIGIDGIREMFYEYDDIEVELLNLNIRVQDENYENDFYIEIKKEN